MNTVNPAQKSISPPPAESHFLTENCRLLLISLHPCKTMPTDGTPAEFMISLMPFYELQVPFDWYTNPAGYLREPLCLHRYQSKDA